MLFGAARLVAGMGAARARRIGRNARAQGVAIAALALFAIIALVFFLTTVTVALAGWLGLLEALIVELEKDQVLGASGRFTNP